MTRRLAPFAIALLLASTAANAWWDAAWGFRKSITVDTSTTGANVAAPAADVPVLVRLHTGNFTHFLDLTERGGDIRFMASDDLTPLKHHVERFDPVNELAFIWVRMPTVQGGSDANKIWMYFGNPAGPQAEDLVGTYGPNEVMVLHYDEASGTPQDKTANANNAVGFTGQQNTGSLIGSGARLAGSGSVTVNDSPSLKATAAQGWTFSTWLKIDAAQSDSVLMERVDGTMQLLLGIDGTHAYAKFTDSAGSAIETPRTAALTPATWHHIALVMMADKLSVFIDGNETATVAGTFSDIGGPISIGGSADGSRYVTADIDETRVANIARNASQLQLMARTEGMDAKALVYSADETPDTEGASEEVAHGPSTFGIILNSVFGNKEAVVEQAVIGFCGIMALVAFAVMVLKFIYLSKCKVASRRFLKAYHALGAGESKGSNIASLAKEEDTYGDSPLFRLYKLGIDEMRKRLQKTSPSVGAAATRGIEGRSIEAIRASLDATMVREGQKLNSQMVLLTIAISGGPFIGLLGTVVGVMVTFAAIAASGDVNINAIAPGMAAALLATVAGLGVAIPALFGYNYLGSMVKEISADMHVFTDEFIARVAEQYGR